MARAILAIVVGLFIGCAASQKPVAETPDVPVHGPRLATVTCGSEQLLIVGDGNVSGTCREHIFVVSCDGTLVGVSFGVSRYDCRIRFERGACADCGPADLAPPGGGPKVKIHPFPLDTSSRDPRLGVPTASLSTLRLPPVSGAPPAPAFGDTDGRD